MSAASASILSAPTLALPGVWRGDAWACGVRSGGVPVWSSGHPPLDAELPGGGWPTGELIELLQAPHSAHEWRLLGPALRHAQRCGPLVLVGPLHPPHLAAWAAQGIDPAALVWVDTPASAERLWAAEQVLRSGTAGAVLAWLPDARPEALRRLHLAARAAQAFRSGQGSPEACGSLLVALRPESMRWQASPAPMRLMLAGDQGRLSVQVFKRRGPPMLQPLSLNADLPVTACLRHWPPSPASPFNPPASPHVVDRPVALAPSRRRQPHALA